MKILVTGAKGFIARNLLEQLGEGNTLVGINRLELDLLSSDEVLVYLKEQRFDIVIHTATYDAAPKHSSKDPKKVLENNLRMFFNLARAQDHFGKMIFFGSGAEFDREHWQPQMKEDYFDQHVPADQYGFSKYLMTKYARSSKNIYNLRLFGVFGKYDDWRTRFIPNACGHAVLGLPIRVDQNRRLDFLYINDLARIVKWFIANQPSQRAYNVCTSQSIDLLAVAKMIVNISGKKLSLDLKAEGVGREYSGDNSLLLNELKGCKFSPLEGSLKELYDWTVTNISLIEKDKL